MTLSPSVTWPSAAMTTLGPRRTQITVVERIRRPPESESVPASGSPTVDVENRRGGPAGGVTTDSSMLSSLYALWLCIPLLRHPLRHRFVTRFPPLLRYACSRIGERTCGCPIPRSSDVRHHPARDSTGQWRGCSGGHGCWGHPVLDVTEAPQP